MRRFYRDVSIGVGWRVLLDGRAVKTQGGRPQLLPTEALARAMAAEWAAQGEDIDPALFLYRDLADYALDVITADPAAARTNLLRYAETDTLCYRAEPDEPLFTRQQAEWEPLIRSAETRWQVHFTLVSGIIHQPQPPATLARLEAGLALQDDFTLAALVTLASLSASLMVALAALEPEADVPALWRAAELEESWQAEQWGSDAEAELRRKRRFAAFSAAAEFAKLARS